ncbi:MAG: DUF354 domain-containing protein [Halohasta sp.]
MRVQFDVTHPAHVHLFKHAIRTLAAEGHAVAVASRRKEVTTALLDAYGIEHTVLSTKGSTPAALVAEWSLRELRTIRYTRAFEPDVVVSRVLPSAVHAAALAGAASVVVTDTEYAGTVSKLVAPFVDYWVTPAAFSGDYGDRQRTHEGFDELAYLHPEWFSPDADRLQEFGVDPDEPYAVVRFVSMGAHHDLSRAGFSAAGKRRLVEALAEDATVYISAEGSLPPELADYEQPVPPAEIHHLLAFADVMVGDSETMTTEAALLGTPTIRSNSHATDDALGVFVDLEARGLVESIADEDAARERALELLASDDADERWARRRADLLETTDDVTDHLLDVIAEAADGEGVTDRDTDSVANTDADSVGETDTDTATHRRGADE